MKIHLLHSWDVTPQEAVQIQEQLRTRVVPRGHVPKPKLVAGADAAFDLRTREGLIYSSLLMC
ncbi:MAG: hypothetical protein OEV38_20740 [Nitrospira sp.]|nr:hypothetical protein [Nitrospira sp.]